VQPNILLGYVILLCHSWPARPTALHTVPPAQLLQRAGGHALARVPRLDFLHWYLDSNGKTISRSLLQSAKRPQLLRSCAGTPHTARYGANATRGSRPHAHPPQPPRTAVVAAPSKPWWRGTTATAAFAPRRPPGGGLLVMEPEVELIRCRLQGRRLGRGKPDLGAARWTARSEAARGEGGTAGEEGEPGATAMARATRSAGRSEAEE
jgi:hypothetical protein